MALLIGMLLVLPLAFLALAGVVQLAGSLSAEQWRYLVISVVAAGGLYGVLQVADRRRWW